MEGFIAIHNISVVSKNYFFFNSKRKKTSKNKASAAEVKIFKNKSINLL